MPRAWKNGDIHPLSVPRVPSNNFVLSRPSSPRLRRSRIPLPKFQLPTNTCPCSFCSFLYVSFRRIFFTFIFIFLLFLFYFFILLWWGKVRERSPTSSEGEGRGGEWLRRYGGRSYRSGSTWLLLFTGNDEFIFKKIREGVSYYRLHCELARAPFASGVSACLLARMPDRQTIRRSFSRRRS